MKDTFIIGGSYKQSSGYISTIIGSFKENDEIIYVATTNRPDCPFMCYWDNGNCYFYNLSITLMLSFIFVLLFNF